MGSLPTRSAEGRKGFISVLVAAFLLLFTGCGSASQQSEGGSTSERTEEGASASREAAGPLRPEESRVLGVFPDPTDTFFKAIVAPTSVKTGERFVVIVTTTGSGCERVGVVGVLLGERDATLMVYDFTSANRPGIDCTLELKSLKHEIPLTFSKPGEARIRIWGRRQRQTSPPYGEPEVLEHRIEVR